MNKVILISIDGMRPDGFLSCGNPYTEDLMRDAAYTLSGRTVFPSLTLPCHMSLFHSVPPQRHGITENTYTAMARPVKGLFEVVEGAGGVGAMYYGWEPLRDVSRPDSLTYASYFHSRADESSDTVLTDMALERIAAAKPDFVFLYMVETDQKGGHDNGWMSQEYLRRISKALDNVRRVCEAVGEEYTVIITADHGGHDRDHGSELAEDMTIPLFFIGDRFTPGKVLEGVSIMDVAPTVADVMGLRVPWEWEGRSLAE